MEKIIRQFSRDFSLYVCEWLVEGLRENFKREIGAGYEDYVIQGDGKSITTHYISRDLEAITSALFRKLRSDRRWYGRMSAKFREDSVESRKIIEKFRNEGKLTLKVVNVAHGRHLKLFPMLRLSILVPSILADKIREEFGKYGEEVISLAYGDRKSSDGVFEANDYMLRALARKKLIGMGRPENYAKVLTTKEVISLATDGKMDFGEIEKRSRGFVFLSNEIVSSRDFGKTIKKFGYYHEPEKLGTEIRGVVAFDGGKVRGKVCKLAALEELSKFKSGNVLVTPMTVPDFLPAMRAASAIVTDEGGITCHAAIVARELGKPCVIGTKNATRILRDGDLVEVDSHSGKIRKIN
ncbi:MAG TPA: PEP-utilizing enzyme [Candidatus Norongarragalinales archaeon]|nr:PEP-utilizing enzyme [Candidatus Norongarragalinales archaeon]